MSDAIKNAFLVYRPVLDYEEWSAKSKFITYRPLPLIEEGGQG